MDKHWVDRRNRVPLKENDSIKLEENKNQENGTSGKGLYLHSLPVSVLKSVEKLVKK